MTRHMLQRRLRAALDGERGFTILETVIAMTVVFASLTALAYTATVGFRYVAIGRDRIQATGAAEPGHGGDPRALVRDDHGRDESTRT